MTLSVVQRAELELDAAREEMAAARADLEEARLGVRTARNDGEDAEDAELPGVRIGIKELGDVLLKDVGNKIGS
eukprot:SAG11_NODE_6678_length_1268_cov_0.834046_2_plen_73_part_01